MTPSHLPSWMVIAAGEGEEAVVVFVVLVISALLMSFLVVAMIAAPLGRAHDGTDKERGKGGGKRAP